MSLFVDTSVWSLALRRDGETSAPEVSRLHEGLAARESIFTTGLVLQELLQGFHGPKARDAIIDRFAALPTITPDREDHIAAAGILNSCRRRGVQVGTIDALLVRLCLRHELVMLTRDDDFRQAARHVPFKVWSA